MIKILKRIKDFLLPPEPEYYQYLGGSPRNPGFNKLFSKQIERIIEIINEELEISRGFGLEIKKEDEKKEKIVILTIFNMYGQGLMRESKRLSIEECNFVISSLIKLAGELLSAESEFYYEYFKNKEAETGKKEAKNSFSCHLESIIFRITHEFLQNTILP